MTLQPDAAELSRFVGVLFRYASSGSYVSLRSFDQINREAPPFEISGHQVNGSLEPIIRAATEAARRAAENEQPIVFAPPIATFTNPRRARAEDLANGLVLSVELDEGNSVAALRRLEAILGFATCVVESGSEWLDDETGEVTPKVHMHWRLSEPTITTEEHNKLRQARDLAGSLVGADPTGKPVVHPLRWPGSWNRKQKPRLAKISAMHEAAEINLDDALDRLHEAVEAAGMAKISSFAGSGRPQAPPDLIITAMALAPNPDLHYDEWVRRAYAVVNAMGDDERAYETFRSWSEKSAKHQDSETEALWRRVIKATTRSNPPVKAGAGTIFFHALKAGWSFPDPEPPPWVLEGPKWESIDIEAHRATEPPAPDAKPLTPFPATPITFAEWDDIPPREKVYGHFLFRKFISAIGAPGGAGKTAYAFVIAFAVAVGRDLLKEHVHEAGGVWIYNLEDPRTELLRRVKAAAVKHGIKYDQIKDRVWLDSGRDRPLVIATTMRNGDIVAWPQVPALVEEIKMRGVRLLIIDPFVRSHRVEENVNDQVDFVAALWASVADQADCAVLLLHHFKKGGASGDAGAFRGASALIDASRAAVTLTTMSQDEAQRFAILEKERWQYVRVDNAKLNLAPPPENAVWLRLEGVDLCNGTEDRESDNVQSVIRWEPPSAFAGMSQNAVINVLERLRNGPGGGEQFYLTGGTTGRWAGLVIMAETGKKEGEAKRIIAAWKKSGLIKQCRYDSPTDRRERSGMEVDEVKFQEIRQQGEPSFPE